MPFDIDNATKAELMQQAEALGLKPASNTKLDDLRALVRQEMPQEAEAPTATIVAPDRPHVTQEKKFRVTIAKTAGATGADDVFVGVNGKTWLLQRGVEIENVPESVVGVLKNAVEKSYEQKVDPQTNKRYMVEREVQAYPFSAVPQ